MPAVRVWAKRIGIAAWVVWAGWALWQAPRALLFFLPWSSWSLAAGHPEGKCDWTILRWTVSDYVGDFFCWFLFSDIVWFFSIAILLPAGVLLCAYMIWTKLGGEEARHV